MGGGAGKIRRWWLASVDSPWGVITKGYKTRNKRKLSNRFILVRRDGRPMKHK